MLVHHHFSHCSLIHFFFYKNIVFRTEARYSYFRPNILSFTSVLPCHSIFLKLDRNTSDTVLFLLENSFLKNKYFAEKQEQIYRYSNLCIPHVRTNYGKFSIKFVGAKVWNSLDEDLKNLDKTPFKSNYFKPLLTHISPK